MTPDKDDDDDDDDDGEDGESGDRMNVDGGVSRREEGKERGDSEGSGAGGAQSPFSTI